jgi:Flp pilus assembly protein TadG
MTTWRDRFTSCNSGQALIEAALIVPFMLTLIFNVVNFGYFFLVALNVASAPRTGVEYAIMGPVAPAGQALPAAGPSTTNSTVSYLVYQDMTGAIYSPSTKAAVQVCTKVLGLKNSGLSTQASKCATYGTYTSPPSPASDPESPSFVLQRVDVSYQFTPLIPATPFALALLPSSVCSSKSGTVTCTFHRQVSMRAMD